jgi:hypothetical protein
VLRYMLISMAIGVLVESLARLLKLWLYGQPQTAVLNIVGFFGFVMGGIAAMMTEVGRWQTFALAAGVGFAYEVLNLRFLHWWQFPGERLLFVRGHHAIVLVLAVLWGTLPLVTSGLQAAVLRGGAPTTIEGRLERLNVQEQRLLEALDATRQKERALADRLEQTRRKKQILLDRQAVRAPGRTADTRGDE